MSTDDLRDDDRLLAALTGALDEPVPEPTDEQIEAVRAAMRTRRAEFGSGTRSRGVPWWAAAAAAAVVIAGVLGFVLGQQGTDEHLAGGVVEFEETLVAPSGPAAAEVTGVLTGIGRVVQIRSDELPILPTGEYYEVWFVGPGDTPDTPNRISAGTFHPDENGVTSVDLAAAVNPALFPVLSVTAEPGDGDPAPTGPEVLRTTITITP